MLVNTAGLSREQWLAWRRRGIGGSDVAAIFGISPFRTSRDVYYDKLNIAPAEPDEGNWVALEMGHLLEDLVARIFSRKTGFPVFQIKKMFRHAQYPFMLADVDYFANLPGGETAIVEIKTTNYNAKEHWWTPDGKETVPAWYETQGRHYMAVMNLDRVFFCCLYGNSEDEVIIRELRRDAQYEEEMIYLEKDFWENHVQAKRPPPYLEDGGLIVASAKRYGGPADPLASAVPLDVEMLYRNLLYTGITRAREKVILVGQRAMLYMAIHRSSQSQRNTLLGERIRLYHKAFAKSPAIVGVQSPPRDLKAAG